MGGALAIACAEGLPLPPEEPEAPPAPSASDSAAPALVTAASDDAGAEAASKAELCPPDMVHVKKDFCTDVERRCQKSEYDKSNHITLCHRFEEGSTKCRGERVALDFCIDRYEYPNQKGGHPPVMVSFYDGSGLCAERDKRLCYESEWTAACEGPEEKPFPYGWERSSETCNIDNAWVNPSLKKIYSADPKISEPELRRLDRSVPSGGKPGCVSDYGVFDLTGNVDEWTLADHDRKTEKARFAALKGGAWGHVRNACRPMTTSHPPDFRYYFISFRCCRDINGAPTEASR